MTPSSFCTISTKRSCHELEALLKSLELVHAGAPVYIYCDSDTLVHLCHQNFRLNITWFVKLDKYSDINRNSCGDEVWTELMYTKADVIKTAVNTYGDTLYLDSDIVVLHELDIDSTKEIGLSPQFIKPEHVQKCGYYNGGFIWTKTAEFCDYWKSRRQHSRYTEQAALEDCARRFTHFEFDNSYNLQCWRYYLGNGPIDSVLNESLKCIHTHFGDERFKEFNDKIITYLKGRKQTTIVQIIQQISSSTPA